MRNIPTSSHDRRTQRHLRSNVGTLCLSTIESEDAEDEIKYSEREELRLLDKDLKVDLMLTKQASHKQTQRRPAALTQTLSQILNYSNQGYTAK